MPTIHREGGFAFRIYPRDHGPPHVHAVSAAGYVKIGIGAAPTVIRVGRGVTDRSVLDAVRVVEREWRAMLEAWKDVHEQNE